MSTRTDALTRQVSAAREELGTAFEALERELEAAVDWRTYVRKQPALALGIAAAGGALLGSSLASRRPSRRELRRRTPGERSRRVASSVASGGLLGRVSGLLLDLVVPLVIQAYRGRESAIPVPAGPSPQRRSRERTPG